MLPSGSVGRSALLLLVPDPVCYGCQPFYDAVHHVKTPAASNGPLLLLLLSLLTLLSLGLLLCTCLCVPAWVFLPVCAGFLSCYRCVHCGCAC